MIMQDTTLILGQFMPACGSGIARSGRSGTEEQKERAKANQTTPRGRAKPGWDPDLDPLPNKRNKTKSPDADHLQSLSHLSRSRRALRRLHRQPKTFLKEAGQARSLRKPALDPANGKPRAGPRAKSKVNVSYLVYMFSLNQDQCQWQEGSRVLDWSKVWYFDLHYFHNMSFF